MTSAMAVARYLLVSHLRTRAFAAPFAATVVGVVTIYSVAPNPVLPTAGSVATLLFFTQAWLGLAFFDTQHAADRRTVAAAAGHRALVGGRFLGAAALAAAVAAGAVLAPVATGSFDHTPRPAEVAVCFVATLAAGLAGTGLSALFAAPLVRSRAVGALGLAACLLATVPLGAPALAIARALDSARAAAVPLRLVPALAEVAGLGVVVVVICAAAWRRCE